MAYSITDPYEYTVTKKIEGKMLLRRVLFITGYVFYVFLALTFALITRLGTPMLALVPVTLWIIIYFTWPYCSVEYEYSFIDGYLTFSEIYGSRKRKEKFSVRVCELENVSPYTSRYERDIDVYEPKHFYVALSSEKSPKGPYFALFKNEKGERCVFYFEATNRALRIMKYHNQAVIMSQLEI